MENQLKWFIRFLSKKPEKFSTQKYGVILDSSVFAVKLMKFVSNFYPLFKK
jgi:hypothetical protein